MVFCFLFAGCDSFRAIARNDAEKLAQAEMQKFCVKENLKVDKVSPPEVTQNEKVLNSDDIIPWAFFYSIKLKNKKTYSLIVEVYSNGRVHLASMPE